MDQLCSIVSDLLQFLSANPGAYAVVATIVGSPFIIVAALIARDNSGRKIKRKRNRLIAKLKRTCPHIDVKHVGRVVHVESLCTSVGNNPWRTCTLCGKRFTKNEENLLVQRWLVRSLEEPFRNQAKALKMSVKLSEELAELSDDPRSTR